ncbi:52 kDa repressor of the inhibitor of the protein kinase-like [Xenia sp. Carnegie-2017]|uniref:52 kDa repressor of the inhibitor of the protein kinase-like n=1 Tax=Xenia sp. Carnegie-2017 TaxID=2897299 RepID=UPI001F03FB98|nr:52 kDa repressor of the inhibitor of the protein kinase-like [Xenia sp. Carnegie-2017]
MIMDAGIKKEIEQNREILSPIIDSVIFCGRLDLPLRGHRDDSKYHPTVGCYSSGGVGNFIETLNYGVRRGDKVLENHLKNYASDSSHKEQMSLVLRFVDTDMNIREEFISFLFCKWGLSGAQLAKLLLEALKELTLSIDDCRGQGYDGAGSVPGCTNGLAAQILKLNPKALYTHCYSHRLNLSICDSLSIRVVNDMLKHVNNATNFIKISQTRNIPFEKHTRNSETNSKKTRLTDVCKTRWVERIEGLDTFQELFVPVYTTLNDMSENVDGEFKPSLQSDASSLFQLIDRFDFVVALVITRNILDSTLPVTQLLQGKSIDIMDGIHLISTLKTEVVNMRNSSDFYHDTWYDEALELAAKVGIEEWKPRTVRKQTTRENIPHTTISEYHKRAITLPLLDHLQSSLESRFDLESVNVYKGLSIVPTKMMSMTRDGVDWKEPFKTVANLWRTECQKEIQSNITAPLHSNSSSPR